MAHVSCLSSSPAGLWLKTKSSLSPVVRAYVSLGRQQLHTTVPVTQTEHRHDVVVVGGGLVGTAMACALGCSKLLTEKSILLLEGASSKPFVMKSNFSNRVSAINSSTVGLFKDIGIWEKIEGHRAQQVKKMQVWDASSDGCISFSNDGMTEPVAYIIENDLMLWALSERLKDFPNVSVTYNSNIVSYDLPAKNSSGLPNLVLEDGRKLMCELLIGADGANSKIRSLMQTRYWHSSYDQVGVVATLRLSEKTDNVVAWQRFLPSGPIALLPLHDDVSSLVWSTKPSHAKELVNLPNEFFVNAVNEAFMKEYPKSSFVQSTSKCLNSFLGIFSKIPQDVTQLPPKVKYVDDGSRAMFPLGVGNASRYKGNCVVLIGDAAHRVHPLAGQGVNLGFGDVHSLAHLLEAAVYNGAHLGKGHHLSVYESEREREDVRKVFGIHILHSLYDTTFTPFVALRSLGLSIVHSIPSLKKAIMKQAST